MSDRGPSSAGWARLRPAPAKSRRLRSPLRGFDERWEDKRRRTRACREAFQAAQARAAGKSRDEIREIYLGELNARDLTQPGDAVLNAVVDRISGNLLPAVRLAAESLAQVGKGTRELSRRFRSGG